LFSKENSRAIAGIASALGGLISLLSLVWFLWPKNRRLYRCSRSGRRSPGGSSPSRSCLWIHYRDIIRKAIAFVSVDQTLADAKAAMDAVPGCQDVIVTQSGAPTMPVIGWIMNTDIGRLSQA
jgi:hypothetical protein